jgi:thiamine biosynthesis protein ThiI
MEKTILSIACSEISLKGRNRPHFERLLMRNMRFALSDIGRFELRERGGRVLAIPSSEYDPQAAKNALARVFGIDNVSISAMVPPGISDIESSVRSIQDRFKGKSIRVETKRSDKRFPMTSQEVSARVGSILVQAGCTVDLKNPDETIYVDILGDSALITLDKVKGPGGMPVGSSGKVLSLLSGGIDSPVASWMMMKRGCVVDLLHVHASPRNEDALKSKMARLAGRVGEFAPDGIRLTIAPYSEFYKKAMAIDHRSEVVVFRRFLLKLASALARREGAMGIVTGDSIGQVASQTVENIYAADEAADMPVFRPLVAFNKQEIIDIAKRIGTMDISIEAYKDCCSLVASPSPSTKVSLETAKSYDGLIGMDAIVEKTMQQAETIEL